LSTKSLLKILLLQTAAVAAAVGIYLAWDADALYEWLSGDVEYVAAPPCDLHQRPCPAALGDGTPVLFSISPRPVPVMQKLRFELNATLPPDAKQVVLELYGLNMNMGRYRYTLEAVEPGRYRGEGMIPSCVAQMQWRANIIAEAPTRRIGTYFTLTTE